MTPAVYQWAVRHGVTMQALIELQTLFGMHGGQRLDVHAALGAAHRQPAPYGSNDQH